MKLLSAKSFELLILPIAIALSFSAFIYWEYFHLTSRIVNTLLGLGAIYGLLHAPKRTIPIAGFWIGLLWCYWIGFSFQYYGFAWAIPLIALGFGAVYALFFGTMALSANPFIRAAILFALTYVWPMDFNWMQPELIFVESYIGIYKWQFALVLFSLALSGFFTLRHKWIPLLLLIGTLQFQYDKVPLPPLKIKLITTQLPQDMKWQASELENIVRSNLIEIKRATDEHYDVVVLPEAAFTLYMNYNPDLVEYLKDASKEITIFTGTLYREKDHHYNVSCLFENGKVTFAKKMILVPFGEYIPLPSFMRGWVNRTIFGGGSDFLTAERPTDYIIHGIKFRNAICYEATRQELYTPDARYMIAISNNGWFTPSIEPTLQNLLIRFYARKNSTIVFHATNAGGTGVVF